MMETRRRRRGWWAGALALLLGWAPAGAHPTGLPGAVALMPRSVVQGDGATSPVMVTVVLKEPSPTFFVCELRSSDPRVVRFSPLIFAKGQLQAKGNSVVYWSAVMKAEDVTVTAFSVDNPDVEVKSKLTVQPKPDTESE
jgi:hypothetical protein